MTQKNPSILALDGWMYPAAIPEAQVGTWRIKKLRRHGSTHVFSMFNVLGYDYAIVEGKMEMTLLQEFREGKWRDWMTDDVLFWHSMKDYAERAVGPNVLIGGLGLGLILRHLSQLRPDLKRIVVIEREPEVIMMVWKNLHLDSRFLCLEGDFFRYMEEDCFDTVITDFPVGSPHSRSNQDLFLQTFEYVNTHWPYAQHGYHGMEPWNKLMSLLWRSGRYQLLVPEARRQILRTMLKRKELSG